MPLSARLWEGGGGSRSPAGTDGAMGEAGEGTDAGTVKGTAVPSTGSFLGPGRSESLITSLGWWANNLSTPTGNGEGGLQSYFRERSGMRVMGLSYAMYTPRNLEDFLHQREEVSLLNEPVNLEAEGLNVEVSERI
jgi:hypothetical protein